MSIFVNKNINTIHIGGYICKYLINVEWSFNVYIIKLLVDIIQVLGKLLNGVMTWSSHCFPNWSINVQGKGFFFGLKSTKPLFVFLILEVCYRRIQIGKGYLQFALYSFILYSNLSFNHNLEYSQIHLV